MFQPLIFRGVTIQDHRKTFVKKTTKWKHKHIWAKKKRLLSIKSWLFDRDPCNGLLQSPHNTRIFSFLIYLRDPKLVKQKQLQRKVSKKETVAVSVNAKDLFFFVPFFFGGGFWFWGGGIPSFSFGSSQSDGSWGMACSCCSDSTWLVVVPWRFSLGRPRPRGKPTVAMGAAAGESLQKLRWSRQTKYKLTEGTRYQHQTNAE